MTGWEQLEGWFAELVADDLRSRRSPAPVVLCGDAHGPTVLILARPESDRDGVDAVCELGAAIAALRPQAGVMSLPGRLRDLAAGPDAPPVGRSLVLTSVRHDHDVLDLRVRSLPLRGDGTTWSVGAATDLEVEFSPVASMIEDVSRHHVDLDPVQTLAVLTSWGHLVGLPSETAGVHPDAGLPPPTARARHRVHRHALELRRRHQPLGSAAMGQRRPAVVTGIPPGWEPACDL